MGILDTLIGIAAKGVETRTNDYNKGYDKGSHKASSMSDSELRSELRKAKENGVSNFSDYGKTRAMMDEYKNRKK